MANAFGYEPQPQQPGPDPVKVGMMLRKMRSGGGSDPTLEAMGHSPSAMSAMANDMGGRTPDMVQNPGFLQHDSQLAQLGVSPWEIQMMRRAGAIR